MIAVDTNILVAARREELSYHAQARRLLQRLVRGDEAWAIPWPCVYEFLRVVTHRRIFRVPTPLSHALDDLASLLAAPALTLLSAGPAHAGHLQRLALAAEATGDLVFDAHIAALCLEHGVTELWTHDRDFARFSGLRTRNPFK